MPYQSGHARTVTLGTLTLKNVQFTVDIETIADDVTNAASAGWAETYPVLRRIASLEIEAVDDGDYGAALALVGTFVNVSFDAVPTYTGVLVDKVQLTNEQQRVRRIRVSCSHGRPVP